VLRSLQRQEIDKQKKKVKWYRSSVCAPLLNPTVSTPGNQAANPSFVISAYPELTRLSSIKGGKKKKRNAAD